MNDRNYIIGGKLGDFFHSLYVAKCFFDKNKEKADIFITDNPIYGGDVFTSKIQDIFEELKGLISKQEYVNKFEILSENISADYINLNAWRSSPNLYRTNWSNLLNMYYGCGISKGAWIKSENENDLLKNKVIIHHSTVRQVENFPWEDIIMKNECIFVGFNPNEYEVFKYKHLLYFHKINTIEEYVELMLGCKFFVGNQSAPLAIAHSLGIPRLGALCRDDAYHYIGEENIHDNLYWISNFDKNIEGIEKFIKI